MSCIIRSCDSASLISKIATLFPKHSPVYEITTIIFGARPKYVNYVVSCSVKFVFSLISWFHEFDIALLLAISSTFMSTVVFLVSFPLVSFSLEPEESQATQYIIKINSVCMNSSPCISSVHVKLVH